MSSLPGHARITRAAVAELATENPAHPIYTALGAAGLQTNVVARDIIDVIILGHWADFGQCHHFMRRFDGQSEYEAWEEAVEWIRRNALDAARTLANQILLFYGSAGVPGGPAAPDDPRAVHAMAGKPSSNPRHPPSNRPSWQCLGNAIHATQDSFAWGHAEREPGSPGGPGAIRRVKRYAGSDKDGHKEADYLWFDAAKKDFSRDGRYAIDATKSLLRIVVDNAVSARGGAPIYLAGFPAFQATWLAPAKSLSRNRDRAFDLIDRHYTGARLGASNFKTISMDEKGLAKSIYTEAGTDTALVLRVFERLEEHYSSDSDDVAELYVNFFRAQGGPVEKAVAGNKALVKKLVEILEDGWTSSGEQACIGYLKKLL